MQAFYKSFHENFTLHYSEIEPSLYAIILKKGRCHIKNAFKSNYQFNEKTRCRYRISQ